MNRAAALARLAGETFDVLVVGGGATGLGAAVDAASRGYRTALIEADDFASATSSRSTKLIHGGVRYLRQGNVGLVREALRERTALRRNAPHLVHNLTFVVPAYHRLEIAYYAAGLAAYDLLAGSNDFPRSRIASAARARELVPALEPRGLRGAVVYHDGSFDDARLAIALARTASDHGAAVANYVRATAFAYDANGRISGVTAMDRESRAEFPIRARAVINATGIFADTLRALDEPAAPRLLAHSRGSHVVVWADALEGTSNALDGTGTALGSTGTALGGTGSALGGTGSALLVPKTADGRVLFALPWHGHVVIGTTDVPVAAPESDPVPDDDEIEYILATVNRYLAAPLARSDVRAVFAGLRPLIARGTKTTARLSREHLVDVSPSGLVTIAGGKWTTYRVMARDAVDAAARAATLPAAPSRTSKLPLHGARAEPTHAESPHDEPSGDELPRDEAPHDAPPRDEAPHDAPPRDDASRDGVLHVYGTDAAAVRRLVAEDPALGELLDPRLPYTAAQVVYGARAEMARTVEDVLARRTRALFLDVEAARAAAPRVAELLARELSFGPQWPAQQLAAFTAVAARRAAGPGAGDTPTLPE